MEIERTSIGEKSEMVSMDIRILPEQDQRVETGPVQFGDDWPGLFIRGDNAAWFGLCLKAFFQDERVIDVAKSDKITYYNIKLLESLLSRTNVRGNDMNNIVTLIMSQFGVKEEFECNSVRGAARIGCSAVEHNSAAPMRIDVDGVTVWENTGPLDGSYDRLRELAELS